MDNETVIIQNCSPSIFSGFYNNSTESHIIPFLIIRDFQYKGFKNTVYHFQFMIIQQSPRMVKNLVVSLTVTQVS